MKICGTRRKAAYLTYLSTSTWQIDLIEAVWPFNSTKNCESGERHGLGDKHNRVVDLISGQGFLGLPQQGIFSH